MYVTLEQAKRHLMIDDTYIGDDESIMGMIEAAEAIVYKTLCVPLEHFLSDGILSGDVLYTVLLMIANLYNNREPVAFAKSDKVHLSYDYLASLNKDYSK